MKENKKIELKRVNMNLPISLIERIEDYAYKTGLNVTSAYITLLNQALDQKDTLNILPLIMNTIKEMTNIDDISDNDDNDMTNYLN